MERELYRDLYTILWALGKKYRSRHVEYSDARILLVYFWAVLHDRPIHWACRKQNWPVRARGGQLPSDSTMSRRLRRPAIRAFMEAVEQRLRSRCAAGRGPLHLDGKPLPVGGLSGDPDATCGFGAGKIARGYKLHAICDAKQVLLRWAVQPLNVSEHRAAMELVGGLGDHRYLVADGNYDKNPLYEKAGQKGLQLVAALKTGKALGHRHHSVYRIAAGGLPAELRDDLMNRRRTIERCFGTLCSGTAALGPLPSWVRRLPRVRRWVHAKIIIHYLRMIRRQKLNAA